MPLAVGSPRQRKTGNIPNASVAQLVEQKTLNLLVLGSNPSRGTFLHLISCGKFLSRDRAAARNPPVVFRQF
jgi:hypothetical protein